MNSSSQSRTAQQSSYSNGQRKSYNSSDSDTVSPGQPSFASYGSYSPASYKSSPTHSTSGESSPATYFNQLSLGSDRDGSSSSSLADDKMSRPSYRGGASNPSGYPSRQGGSITTNTPYSAGNTPLDQAGRPAKKSRHTQNPPFGGNFAPGGGSMQPSTLPTAPHHQRNASSQISGRSGYPSGTAISTSGGYGNPSRSSSLPMPPAPERSQTQSPFTSSNSAPGDTSLTSRSRPMQSGYTSASRFEHGPTELPPRPYNEGERPGPPQKLKGRIPGSALDFLPILEQRFDRLEGAVEQYIEHRAQRALNQSIVPGLEEQEPSFSKQISRKR